MERQPKDRQQRADSINVRDSQEVQSKGKTWMLTPSCPVAACNVGVRAGSPPKRTCISAVKGGWCNSASFQNQDLGKNKEMVHSLGTSGFVSIPGLGFFTLKNGFYQVWRKQSLWQNHHHGVEKNITGVGKGETCFSFQANIKSCCCSFGFFHRSFQCRWLRSSLCQGGWPAAC